MELVCDGSRVAKPRASFVLEKNAQLLVYKWLKSLRFLDGHASNISRLVNTEECRLYEMKSHDYHVFMQTLIPLAFRDLLPKGIWDALTEINHFFRDICSSKLNVDHIERLEKNIIETICQMRVRRHTYRRIEKSGGIFELFWCAYQLISDGITDGI
jgi:hypothetical protein